MRPTAALRQSPADADLSVSASTLTSPLLVFRKHTNSPQTHTRSDLQLQYTAPPTLLILPIRHSRMFVVGNLVSPAPESCDLPQSQPEPAFVSRLSPLATSSTDTCPLSPGLPLVPLPTSDLRLCLPRQTPTPSSGNTRVLSQASLQSLNHRNQLPPPISFLDLPDHHRSHRTRLSLGLHSDALYCSPSWFPCIPLRAISARRPQSHSSPTVRS